MQDPDSDSGQNQTFHIEGGSNTPAADGTSPSDGSHSATGSTDATFTTDYGTLTLDPATGQWTYALNNASDKVQQLNAGETKVETFEVTVTDEHGATSTKEITVTLHGTNDVPWLGQTSIDLKEEASSSLRTSPARPPIQKPTKRLVTRARPDRTSTGPSLRANSRGRTTTSTTSRSSAFPG